ncbi:MAG TPA: hypothetical protein VHT91_14265 [Kofleriaceae bacterium]|jgi:hypothetical protein|nr:hypothetical protein [Kofleriaceae bacterium]
MKKSTPKRLPRKLVLRREAIVQLASTQLDQIAAGGSWLGNCQGNSNQQITCFDEPG